MNKDSLFLFNLKSKISKFGWCYHCQKFIYKHCNVNLLCEYCFNNLNRFNQDCCPVCLNKKHKNGKCLTKESWGIKNAYCVFEYQQPVVKWLIGLKYRGNYFNGRLLYELLNNYLLVNNFDFKDFDIIIPVPSTKKGFLNIFESSTLFLSRFFPKDKLGVNTIVKKKKIPRQATLNKHERELNMANDEVFTISIDVKNLNILLFDDVCTTGATIRNISRLLLRNKAKSISILTLMRERLIG